MNGYHTRKSFKRMITAMFALTLMIMTVFCTTVFAQEEGSSYDIPDRYTIVVFGLDSNKEIADSCIAITMDNRLQELRVTSIPETLMIKPNEEPKEDGTKEKEEALKMFFKDEGVVSTVEHLEQQLELPIDDYLVTSMEDFEKLVDDIGGADVELTKAQTDLLFSRFRKNFATGKQHLNGEETLWVCRIKNGNIPAEQRSATQRGVIESMLSSVEQMNLEDCLEMAADFIEKVEDTTVDSTDIDMVFSMPFTEYKLVNEMWKEKE